MKIANEDVFNRFSKPIRNSIISKGFRSATEPQTKAIPKILAGRNILLVAPTGTGKTEAAFLPILDMLYRLEKKHGGIKVLYVTPLRALNRDLLDRLQWWCKKLDFKLAVRHGDTDVRERGKQALVPPDILITTPETLQAILTGRIMRTHLRHVRWVVVDEVHELAGEKRGSQFALALERLRHLSKTDFQAIGLSATIGTPKKVAKFLVGESRTAEVITVPVARYMNLEIVYPNAAEADYELASKLYTFPDVAARLKLMSDLILNCRSVLLFTNTRTEAEILANRFRMWNVNFPLGVHHGSLSKTSRIETERALKEGDIKGIICTSSLELGIDIGHLDMVIQYNSPRQVTRLIQRVGRSGHRIGEVPKGVLVTQDSEDALEAAVIARRAKEEALEPVEIPDSPLDVLTHQLAGLLLQKNRWRFDEALDILRKAYPYRKLSGNDLNLVLKYMHERYPRLAWVSFEDEVFVKPRDNSSFYNYYFGNLSMIPDEKQFLVLKEDDNSPVGVLDEAFVAEHGEIGVKFVEGGLVWKIKQIYRDRIYVESEKNPLGAIPTWVGDEIPVPFEVASEVGRIRREVEERLNDGVDLETISEDLSQRYPADNKMFQRALIEIEEQFARGKPIPSDKRITLERWKEYIVIQCHAGHLVNKTLARVLGYLLTFEVGASVGVHQDPYRIVLKVRELPLERVKRHLLKIEGTDLNGLTSDAMLKTGIFKRRFLHVAKKFGAVEKDADLTTTDLDKLIDSLRDTAVFKETMKTVLREDSDITELAALAKKISSGEVEIIILGELDDPSPIARIGLNEISRKSDIIPPERMRWILLRSTRARLLNEVRTAICTDCWDYFESRKVADMQNIVCSECGGSRIGFAEDTEQAISRLCERLRSNKMQAPKRYRRLHHKIMGSAELYHKYGFPAIFVLAGKGIRISDAEVILQNERVVNDKLIDNVLEWEKKALKRRYLA